MGAGTILGGIIIILIIIGIAYLAYTYYKAPTTSSSATTTTASGQSAKVPVGMTDPYSAPAGTQAVLLTYSNVQLHTTGSNGGSWVSATGNGTVNTLAVVNASQTIADANVALNATINAVRMNITSATVVINGTPHTATAPAVIEANITSSHVVNASSAVLADFVTNVTAHVNSTSKSTTYAWTSSSSRAVLTTNATVSVNVGKILNLTSAIRVGLGLNI